MTPPAVALGRRRLQISTRICCPRQAAANQHHVAADFQNF